TDAALVEALFRARLAEPRETGWVFVHAIARDSVERLAREAGREIASPDEARGMLALPPRP
ncbi:MAG: hypothetical protein QME96_17875, partial [Myxococcota bacterium]|nr:hypothetical protein [Myxococcota bacterium]